MVQLIRKFRCLAYVSFLFLLISLSLGILLAPYLPLAFFPWLQVMMPLLALLGIFHIFLALFYVSRRPRKYAIPFFILGLLCVGVLMKDYRFSLGGKEAAKPETDQTAIKILSHNLGAFDLGDQKVNKAVRLYQKLDPDVLCFQEFRNVITAEGEEAVQFFARKLDMPYYRFVHLRAHVHGAAVFSRFPILSIDTLYLPPKEINSGILLTIKTPNGPIGVGNLHMSSFMLQHQIDRNRHYRHKVMALFDQTRETLFLQEEKLQKVMGVLNQFELPFVLTGDFNATSHSSLSRKFHNYFDDAFEEVGTGPGWTYPIWNDWGIRIDYQFFDQGITPIQFRTISSDISDHFPTLGTYIVKG